MGALSLNFLATGSAAVSAYYSAQQANLAIRAVNQQSRNETLLKFIEAQDNLCSTSVTPRDQNFVVGLAGDYGVVNVDFDAAEADRGKFDIEAHLLQWQEKWLERNRRYLYLSVWLSKEEEREIWTVVNRWFDINAYRYVINNSKAPAEIEIHRQNVDCNLRMYAALNYLQGFDLIKTVDEFIPKDGIIVYPYTKSEMALKDMLEHWGLGETFETLSEYQ